MLKTKLAACLVLAIFTSSTLAETHRITIPTLISEPIKKEGAIDSLVSLTEKTPGWEAVIDPIEESVPALTEYKSVFHFRHSLESYRAILKIDGSASDRITVEFVIEDGSDLHILALKEQFLRAIVKFYPEFSVEILNPEIALERNK